MFCETHRTIELGSALVESDSNTQNRNIPKHDQTIRHNIRNTKVECCLRIVLDEIFENHNSL